jgi:hypothetical protein
MSIVKTDQIQDRNGNPLIAVADGVASGSFAPVGMRNRIINGDMRIDQRNNGAAVNSASGGSFAVDRFKSFGFNGGVYTTQRSTDVPTGQGFVNSIVATVTTTDSPTGTDYYLITQEVEGFNFADLQWGSASAKSVILSFWVKSSLTGTYTAAFRNSALNRSYRAAYTINAANTWEQKTITVPGDTTGTWLTDNGVGVRVGFTLGAGADFIDTANVWSAVEDFAATGQTQWIATSGATFYITGVQLEAGTVATPFERRQFGAELALCMRYFETSGSGGSQTLAIAASSRIPAYFAVAKRAAPTLVYSFVAGSNTVSLDIPTTGGFRMNNSAGGSALGPCDFTWTASAEL